MLTSNLDQTFTPKNIVITGASSGIGFEAAIELALKGHQVMALARSEEKLKRLQEIVFSLHPEAIFYPVIFDIVHDNIGALSALIKSKFTSVDILINNAGALLNKPFLETPLEDFAEMMSTNFLGHIRIIKELIPMMPPKSHVLNIGSMGGYTGSSKFNGLSAYSASKAALHTLTECLAQELDDKQIKVNCLALGSAQTEMLEQAFPGYQSPVNAHEMGVYVADFALNGHRYFNGKILPVASQIP